MFIYTKSAANSNIQVQLDQVDAFAVFGINQVYQNVSNCVVNISIKFQIISGALICNMCDLMVDNSTLIFIASGQQLAGLMIQSNSVLDIQHTSIQYRLKSQQSSGLIYNVPQKMIIFSLNDVTLIGYHYITDQATAYFVSQLSMNITINILKLIVCIDMNIPSIGVGIFSAVRIGSEVRQCANSYPNHEIAAYGVCISDFSLNYSDQQSNMTLLCMMHFEFNGSHCICKQGYQLNESQCINVVDELSRAKFTIEDNYNTLIQTIHLQQNGTSVQQIEQYILGNVSILSEDIYSLNSLTEKQAIYLQKLNIELIGNISLLDQQLYLNSSIIMQNVQDINKQIQDLTYEQIQLTTQFSNATDTIKNLVNSSTVLASNITQINKTLMEFNQYYLNEFSNLLSQTNTSLIQIQNNISSNISYLSDTLSNKSQQINQYLNSNLTQISGNLSLLEANIQEINSSLQTQYNEVSLNLSQLTNYTQSLAALMQVDIGTNYSKLALNLSKQHQSLDKYIFDNFSLINTTQQLQKQEIYSISQLISNSTTDINSQINIIQQQIDMFDIQNINNSKEINNKIQNILITQQDQKYSIYSIFNQLTNLHTQDLVTQLDNLQNLIILIQQRNIESDIDFTDNNLVELVCNQIVFVQIFDISSISQTVSGFSGKYAISNDTNSAFINLSDNVLNSVTGFQIFQTQRYFYNVKIQIGTQQVDSGSILTDQQQTVLNQVSILSKVGTNLLVNSGSQLNIIHQYSNSTSVRNLLVNLLFSSSSVGNITLVGTVNGVVNVKNYQILGQYYSSNQMCLGALISNNSELFLQKINMQPIVFTVGNLSSYFISYINSSQVQIVKLTILISINTISQLSTAFNQYITFGGIIAQSNQSIVTIKQVSHTDSTVFTSLFVNQTGMLLGATIFDAENDLSLSQLCLYYSLTFNSTAWINMFGLVGSYCGSTSISSVNILFTVGLSQFRNFGILGLVQDSSASVSFQNIQITLSMSAKVTYSNDERNISVIIGSQNAFNVLVDSLYINSSTLVGFSECGLIIGYQYQSQVNIISVNINRSSLLAEGNIGGLISYFVNSVAKLKDIMISNSNIASSGAVSNAGLVVCRLYESQSIIDNLILNSSNVSAQSQTTATQAAGLCAWSRKSKTILSNSQLMMLKVESSFTTTAYAGAIFAQQVLDDQLNLQTSVIQYCSINATGATVYAGIVCGQYSSKIILIFQASFSAYNSVNTVNTDSCQLRVILTGTTYSITTDGC
ncbi:Hypothetical_protein [Hexamita inflata]|uniref:Hypothetical_protein n=1 Tax=Hexamita inflata TaxID=28002 RepID=A0AA86QWS8_9EUKA|nr:Hypothetical protein HINF_LOCUS48893 [Hexamita inflata]